MEQTDFAQLLRDRTQTFAVTIIFLYESLHKSEVNKIIGKQLLRAASSIGANYRAACRARSDAEFFAKLCIVVEEADETLFWLEILEQTQIPVSDNLISIKSEATEILKIMAKARSTLKKRR